MLAPSMSLLRRASLCLARVVSDGSEGLEGMRVNTVKPQKIVFVFLFGHGVIVFMSAQS